MASLSSIGPNQPAKPIAPNPSTLSESPVAGKIRYCIVASPFVSRRGRSEVQDEPGGAGAGDADHHAVVARPLAPRSAPSRGGPARRRAPGSRRCRRCPSAQEDSTPMPASSTTDRIDRSRRDGECELAALQVRPRTRRRARARPGASARTAPRAASRAGQPAAVRFDRGEQRFGAAAVDEGAPVRGCRAGRRGRAGPSRPAGGPSRGRRSRASSSRKAIDARCRPP